MTSAQIKRLQDESRERFRLAKRRLQSAAGTENGYTSRNKGFTDRSSYTSGGLARGERPMFEGEFNVRAGRDPTDAEVMAYIEATGGDPAAKKIQQMMERSKSDKSREALRQRLQGQAGTQQGSSLVDQMLASAKSAVDQANAANDARYGEVKDSNTALYGRVMDKVGDWGGVQSKLNEERAAESLSNQKAYLASRGLANSNVLPAFQTRNDRDLALTQQDLSEKKSAREIAYDIDLTNNANAFIERRNDIAPDLAPYYQIAMEHAKSGAGQAPVEAATGKAKLKRRGGGGGIGSPMNALLASRRGAQLQASLGGVYGYGTANQMVSQGNQLAQTAAYGNAPVNYGPSYYSNAFPHRPGESKDAAYYRRINS
jgi:hypothetical protein